MSCGKRIAVDTLAIRQNAASVTIRHNECRAFNCQAGSPFGHYEFDACRAGNLQVGQLELRCWVWIGFAHVIYY